MTDIPRVQLYTTQFCGFCVAAKRLLEARGVPYQEVDLTGDPARREEVSRRHGWMTVPIVLVEGEVIGGYTELAALDKERGLTHLR